MATRPGWRTMEAACGNGYAPVRPGFTCDDVDDDEKDEHDDESLIEHILALKNRETGNSVLF